MKFFPSLALALTPLLAVAVEPSSLSADALQAVSPTLKAKVAERAIEAVACAKADGLTVDKLIVVDMSQGATAKRLWAFDVSNPAKPRLVLNDLVAHGCGSDPDGDGTAQRFSDDPGSNMTSLGLYRVAERYAGKHGWSRRLDGLFARFNGRARERAVVLHPASYVTDGRAGRSQGCPAVNPQAMAALEKAGLEKAVLWVDGPDKRLEQALADCSRRRASGSVSS